MPLQRTQVATFPTGDLEYRLQPGRDGGAQRAVLFCHGGHLRAAISLGESRFLDAGWSVLVPSRPGYGRTPLTTYNENVENFADQVADLCARLGLSRVVVIGASAGSTAALTLTVRHPELVERLVLAAALSSLPWPDPVTRLTSSLSFHPWMQRSTWTWIRSTLALTPGLGLQLMLASMSTLPPAQVIADLSASERGRALDLFRSMDSGRGFAADLAHRHDEALQRAVRRPTLVVASGTDGAVPFQHAVQLCETIPGAQLWRSPSLSHLIWLGSGAAATEQQIFNYAATGDLALLTQSQNALSQVNPHLD